ncbi:MAG: hypothetical protein RSA01_03605 [Clostridium sp.]|uniref:hypothetical protein n=1 Tax=Clostridium sp. TaxID=1506 RepID=UPI002FCA5D48
MTSNHELKVVGENCTYYSSNSIISAVNIKNPTSCASCSNWSGAKCMIGVFDTIKNLVENEGLL